MVWFCVALIEDVERWNIDLASFSLSRIVLREAFLGFSESLSVHNHWPILHHGNAHIEKTLNLELTEIQNCKSVLQIQKSVKGL